MKSINQSKAAKFKLVISPGTKMQLRNNRFPALRGTLGKKKMEEANLKSVIEKNIEDLVFKTKTHSTQGAIYQPDMLENELDELSKDALLVTAKLENNKQQLKKISIYYSEKARVTLFSEEVPEQQRYESVKLYFEKSLNIFYNPIVKKEYQVFLNRIKKMNPSFANTLVSNKTSAAAIKKNNHAV